MATLTAENIISQYLVAQQQQQQLQQIQQQQQQHQQLEQQIQQQLLMSYTNELGISIANNNTTNNNTPNISCNNGMKMTSTSSYSNSTNLSINNGGGGGGNLMNSTNNGNNNDNNQMIKEKSNSIEDVDDLKSSCNIIINYLPQTMSQDEVRSLFGSMGDVESCKLIRDKNSGQSLGYAFVNYSRSEDAQRALNHLNGIRLQNKTIKVSLARPSSDSIKGANLYVSGLPKTITQAELEAMFVSFGNIITSRILTDNVTGISKGVGFVRFDRKEEAEKAIDKLSGTIPFEGGEPIQVKFANNPATNAQKVAIQMAQAATTLLPMTVLQQAAAAQALALSSLTTSTTRRSTTTTPAITTPLAGGGGVGGVGVGGGGPGPIHHATQIGRFRYSPLAGVPVIAGTNNNNTLSATVSGFPNVVQQQTPTIGQDFYANNAYLQQITGAALSTNVATPNIGGTTNALPTATGISIFVYNLAPETEESVLWQLFGPFGAVLSVKTIKDFTTNKCKGYGFVNMANYEDAISAINALNGSQLGSRTLQVSFKGQGGMMQR